MEKPNFNKFHNRQQDQSDCGVVCLSTLLNCHGSYYSIEELREMSGTNKHGTTMLGLIQAARKIGFEADGYEADIEALKEHKGYSILHVIKEDIYQHYIVCFGFDEKIEKFIISDPSEKKVSFLDKNELEKIWKSKSLILFKATDSLDKSLKKDKLWEWIINLIKPDTNILVMAFLFGVFNSILSLSYAVFSQKFIDSLYPSNSFIILLNGSLLFLFFLLLNALISYLRQIFLLKQGRDTGIRLINFFFSKLIFLPKSFFDTRKTGDLIARMNDTNRIQNTITNIIGKVIIHLLMIISASVAIFNYNTILGAISLVWLPLYLIIILVFHPKILIRQREVMKNYALNESNYIDVLKGVDLIKLSNSNIAFKNQTINIFSNYRKTVYNLGNTTTLYQFISEISGSLFIIGLIITSVFLIQQTQITTGDTIAIIQLSSLLIASAVGLSNLNIEIQEARVAINRMFEFTSIQPEAKGELIINKFQSLHIQNLSFRFAGRSPLLKNVQLSVSKGEWIAIVGESGSGKSTLGQILQKFYDFENGQIIINQNVDFRQITTESWRNLMGVIPQDVNIFNGNVLDNILVGATDTPENVVRFCQDLGFEKFIAELPQGYATILGEEGINLSGGQKQIIALARVLYKKPQLLILDEATAAMDRNTEKFTLEILQKIKREVGILFISHRLHSLKKYADRIYVLENGVISHSGSHQDLLLSENFYSAFWRELI